MCVLYVSWSIRFVREAEDVQALGSRREREATEAKEAAERQARAVMEEVSRGRRRTGGK